MKKVIVFLALAISSIAHSAEGSGKGTITQLYVKNNGSFVRMMFSQSMVNPDNECELANYYIVELDDSDGSNRFYSAILSAYMSQQTVSFWVHGCTSSRYWGGTQPTVTDIYMY